MDENGMEQRYDKLSETASDAVERVRETGGQTLEQGYEWAREYRDKSLNYIDKATQNLTGYVREQPLIAVAAAFAIGYLAAKVLRRVA